jgi:hypothetical protein
MNLLKKIQDKIDKDTIEFIKIMTRAIDASDLVLR